MAEKAAIEVDDDSLSEASKENIDLSGLSSDDSSSEDNEQMLQTASRQGPSKVTRFATDLPAQAKTKLVRTKLTRSDFVPDAVKINFAKKPHPTKQSILDFKRSLADTKGTEGRPCRSNRLDTAATAKITAASYEGQIALDDSFTSSCTLLD